MASGIIQHTISAPWDFVSDLDTCDNLGIYMYKTDTLHIPASATNGVCITIAPVDPKATGRGWVAQFAYEANTLYKVYMRKRINNGSWTAWTQINS